jgi:chromosome segregation ATPase
MVDKGTNEFRIRFDDEEAETPVEPAAPHRQTQRHLRRNKILTIVLSLTLVGLLAIGYFDLKVRLTKLDTAGGQEVQTLSQNLESRFSSLSIKQAQLEKEIVAKTQRIKETDKKLEASAQAVAKSIAASEQSLSRKLDSKIDSINNKLENFEENRKQLAEAIARLQQNLNTIQRNISAVTGEIEDLDTNFTQELAVLAANIENAIGDISKLKTDVAAFSTDIVEIGYLDSRLQKEQRIFQLKLDQVARDMRERFNRLEQTLQNSRQQSSRTPLPARVPAQQSQTYPVPVRPSSPLPTPPEGLSSELQSNADTITEESLQ